MSARSAWSASARATWQTWLPWSRQAETNERVIAFALDKAGCAGR